VQFILKPRAFLLELINYRLHQCFGHEAMVSPIFCCHAVHETRQAHSFLDTRPMDFKLLSKFECSSDLP